MHSKHLREWRHRPRSAATHRCAAGFVLTQGNPVVVVLFRRHTRRDRQTAVHRVPGTYSDTWMLLELSLGSIALSSLQPRWDVLNPEPRRQYPAYDIRNYQACRHRNPTSSATAAVYMPDGTAAPGPAPARDPSLVLPVRVASLWDVQYISVYGFRRPTHTPAVSCR